MLSLPERGTPVDTGLFYELINQMNALSKQVYGGGNSSKIVTPTSSNDSSTSNLRVYGVYKNVVQTVAGVQTLPISNIAFPGSFKYAPVAVATIVLNPGHNSGIIVNHVLTSVTTGSVGASLTFEGTGNVDLRINILAIGVPEGVA